MNSTQFTEGRTDGWNDANRGSENDCPADTYVGGHPQGTKTCKEKKWRLFEGWEHPAKERGERDSPLYHIFS